MTMTNNATLQERVGRCRRALVGYSDDDPFLCLIDFLADAMHWSDAQGENFHYALCVAGKHYFAELNDEQQDERRMS
jgi:hypothetical protein